jgi:hypothetical protein
VCVSIALSPSELLESIKQRHDLQFPKRLSWSRLYFLWLRKLLDLLSMTRASIYVFDHYFKFRTDDMSYFFWTEGTKDMQLFMFPKQNIFKSLQKNIHVRLFVCISHRRRCNWKRWDQFFFYINGHQKCFSRVQSARAGKSAGKKDYKRLQMCRRVTVSVSLPNTDCKSGSLGPGSGWKSQLHIT